MKTLARSLAAAALLTGSSALAQVRLEINVPIPTIRFEVQPPLVVVSPRVQVVEDYDQEVFFYGGWYWVLQEGRWYRTQNHNGTWVYVEHSHVPADLSRIPPGKYRKYKPGKAHYRGEGDKRSHEDRGEHRGNDGRGRDEKHGHSKHGHGKGK